MAGLSVGMGGVEGSGGEVETSLGVVPGEEPVAGGGGGSGEAKGERGVGGLEDSAVVHPPSPALRPVCAVHDHELEERKL